MRNVLSLCLLPSFQIRRESEVERRRRITTSFFTQADEEKKKQKKLNNYFNFRISSFFRYLLCALKRENHMRQKTFRGSNRFVRSQETLANQQHLRLLHLSLYYEFKMFILLELWWFYGYLRSYETIENYHSLTMEPSFRQTIFFWHRENCVYMKSMWKRHKDSYRAAPEWYICDEI